MSEPQPLTEAHRKLRAAFLGALAAVVGDDSDGLPQVYWKRATPAAAPPFLVVQPQGDGRAVDTIGAIGWSGDLVVKSYGEDEAQVETLLEAAEAVINAGVSSPAGYSLAVRWLRPVDIPTAEGLYGAGQRYAVELHRN